MKTTFLRIAHPSDFLLRNLLLIGFFVVFAFSGTWQPLQAQGGSTSFVVIAPAQVDVGEPIQISLTVTNAGDIAGYEAHALFDTRAAVLASIRQRQNDLKKQGRDILPLAVAEDANGATFGFSSCPFSSCLTNQGAKQARANRGTLRLGTLVLDPQLSGRLEIQFDAVKFVDSEGNTVKVANATPRVTVQVKGNGTTYAAPSSPWQLMENPGTPRATADVTQDHKVTAADALAVALGWQTTHENSAPCSNLPDPRLDLNQDGCIDIADVQLAVANAGPDDAAGAQTTTPATFVVNTTNDSADSNPGDGICAAVGGCTLRAAIDEANAHPGPDTINFNIPGSGVHTINLKTNLPNLSDTTGGTTINGYSQPGSSVNTAILQSDAVLEIEVKGAGLSFDAFRIASANNVLRGLSVYDVRRPFYLFGAGAHDNLIVGNFIGTDAGATFMLSPFQSNSNGVELESGAANNVIGTPALADRNVMSGNAESGLATYFEGTDSNVIQNNIIGLSPLGDRNLRNMSHGIDINSDSSNNLIGGTAPRTRNILSGDGDPSSSNYTSGVEISHSTGTQQNKVFGNCFGTGLDCNSAPDYAKLSHYGVRLEEEVNHNEVAYNVIGNTRQGGINVDNYGSEYNSIHDNRIGISANGTSIPNAFFGVRVKFHAKHNTIGPNNIITNNPTGVLIEFNDEDFNTITSNSIYGNSYMGIDLGPSFGVSYNDPGDTDSGANEGLNYPVFTSATPTQVTGSACGDAVVPKPCKIEIFKADRNLSDASAGMFGQGKTLIGTGTSSGSFVIAVSNINVGDYVTATATDADGNTSEFAENFQVTATAPPPTPTPTPGTPTPTITPTPGSGGLPGGWHIVQDSNASDYTYRASGRQGDFLKLNFYAKRIKWITVTGPKMGLARVLIDGIDKGIIDLYGPVPGYMVVEKFKGLGPGLHHLKIIVLGEKNANATGRNVAIDAFIFAHQTIQEDAHAIKYKTRKK